MTVAELIEKLQELPQDAVCFFEYEGAWALVRKVTHETKVNHYWIENAGAKSAVIFEQ